MGLFSKLSHALDLCHTRKGTNYQNSEEIAIQMLWKGDSPYLSQLCSNISNKKRPQQPNFQPGPAWSREGQNSPVHGVLPLG